MATFDWSQCPLVEVIPGKVSGAPLLKNTRLPVDAITGCTGLTVRLAAGTQPVRPLGRPGRLMRYQAGFPLLSRRTPRARTTRNLKSRRNWVRTAVLCAWRSGWARTATCAQLM